MVLTDLVPNRLGGRRAQFFLIILVFMIIIIVGLAYYTVESRQLPRKTRAPAEAGSAMMSQIQTELTRALQDKPYTGKNVSEQVSTLVETAEKKGYQAEINCEEARTTSIVQGYDYPRFNLDCNITLSWEDANITSQISRSYTVPFEIKTFTDSTLATENDMFLVNDTVYYKVTGVDGHQVNITVTDAQDTVKHSPTDAPLSNYQTTGSFQVERGGAWTITAEDLDTGQTTSKVIYISYYQVSIFTYDAQGNRRKLFQPGEEIKIGAKVRDLAYQSVRGVEIGFNMNSSTGQEYYQVCTTNAEGECNSTSFSISSNEAEGTLLITATEKEMFSYNTTTILITSQISPFITIPYDALHGEAFSSTCGYASWFASNTTTHQGINFYIQTSGNDVLRIQDETEIIDVSQTQEMKASHLHIIMSECTNCT